MPTDPTNDQGHNPNDATTFAGLGCLGFVIACVMLFLWWGIGSILDLLR